jgi:hypothetical protein
VPVVQHKENCKNQVARGGTACKQQRTSG